MNIILRYIIAVVVAYLFGSLNSAIIFSKIFMKKDIRQFGSGNAGTTNALRVMGASKAVFVILGDILKNVIPMLLVKPIMGEVDIVFAQVLAAIACVIGHAYPVYFGFKGGKGVLSTATVAWCIDWRISLIAILVFILVVAITKYVSLGSILSVCTAPIQFGLFYWGKPHFVELLCFGLFVAIFVTVLHRANIKRLVEGTENKLSFKKK